MRRSAHTLTHVIYENLEVLLRHCEAEMFELVQDWFSF
jgi:hypothetical protein